ncbi:MAG TPA: hypothetical protein PKZ16_02915 [bacterium]|nr:hypothetical protein [bacterium]HPL95178.1 hypothetical protein [bacterium]
MKKMMEVLAMILALVAVATAQNFVEVQSGLTKPAGSDLKVANQIDISVGGSLVGKIGWWGWALISQYWAEAYAGPSLAPTSWCQMGLAYGIQNGADPNRYGSFIWLGKGPISFIGFYEAGNGYWHRQIANCQVWKTLGVGALNETVVGVGRRTGPRVEFSSKKIKVWGTLMKDKSYVGLDFLF